MKIMNVLGGITATSIVLWPVRVIKFKRTEITPIVNVSISVVIARAMSSIRGLFEYIRVVARRSCNSFLCRSVT